MKIRAEDWHAVSDAANDLREVDAMLRALKINQRKRRRRGECPKAAE